MGREWSRANRASELRCRVAAFWDWLVQVDVNTFKNCDKTKPLYLHEMLASDGLCTWCPVHSISTEGSVSVDECLCDRGYFMETNVLRSMCPSGTFKSTFSNTDKCTPCENAYFSRSGSSDNSHCTSMESPRRHSLYKTLLGLLYYERDVKSSWRNMPGCHYQLTS